MSWPCVPTATVAIVRAGDVAAVHASGRAPVLDDHAGAGATGRGMSWVAKPRPSLLPRVPSVLAKLVKRAPMSVTAERPVGVLALGRAHGPRMAPSSKWNPIWNPWPGHVSALRRCTHLKALNFLGFSGAGEGIRTLDPNLGKVAGTLSTR